MARIELCISFEPNPGQAVTVARVTDRDLILHTAHTALEEADARAKRLSALDPVLGELWRQEARRLRVALELVLPDLRLEAGEAATCGLKQ